MATGSEKQGGVNVALTSSHYEMASEPHEKRNPESAGRFAVKTNEIT
jgi:hypothetical protein